MSRISGATALNIAQAQRDARNSVAQQTSTDIAKAMYAIPKCIRTSTVMNVLFGFFAGAMLGAAAFQMPLYGPLEDPSGWISYSLASLGTGVVLGFLCYLPNLALAAWMMGRGFLAAIVAVVILGATMAVSIGTTAFSGSIMTMAAMENGDTAKFKQDAARSKLEVLNAAYDTAKEVATSAKHDFGMAKSEHAMALRAIERAKEAKRVWWEDTIAKWGQGSSEANRRSSPEHPEHMLRDQAIEQAKEREQTALAAVGAAMKIFDGRAKELERAREMLVKARAQAAGNVQENNFVSLSIEGFSSLLGYADPKVFIAAALSIVSLLVSVTPPALIFIQASSAKTSEREARKLRARAAAMAGGSVSGGWFSRLFGRRAHAPARAAVHAAPDAGQNGDPGEVFMQAFTGGGAARGPSRPHDEGGGEQLSGEDVDYALVDKLINDHALEIAAAEHAIRDGHFKKLSVNLLKKHGIVTNNHAAAAVRHWAVREGLAEWQGKSCVVRSAIAA